MIYPKKINSKMPQLPQSISIQNPVSYPLYLDIDNHGQPMQSPSPADLTSTGKFHSIANFEKLSTKKTQQKHLDLNIFYENLLASSNANAHHLYSSLNHGHHSPLFNETAFNFCLNKVYGKTESGSRLHHHHHPQQSFSIDAILGFASNQKEMANHELIYHGESHPQTMMIPGSNRILDYNNQMHQASYEKCQQQQQTGTAIANYPSNNNNNNHPTIKKSNHFSSQQDSQKPDQVAVHQHKPGHIAKTKAKLGLSTKKSSSIKHTSTLKSNNLGLPVTNTANQSGAVVGNAKSKRVRTIFTPEQLERLETEFEKQQYMVGTGRLYLASTLNLTEAQVKVWFQNRRIKWRKQHLEGYQENANGAPTTSALGLPETNNSKSCSPNKSDNNLSNQSTIQNDQLINDNSNTNTNTNYNLIVV